MAEIHIDGVGRVNVGDEFLKLSPEQQDATVQEIASSFNRPSQGRALALGTIQGATANFGDELIGSGIAANQRARRGGSPLGRSPSEDRKQDEAIAGVRREMKAAQEAHPWTFLGGEVAGAALSLPTRPMQAATLPGRMAGGAVVGGTYGALAGAGEGETAEARARGALMQPFCVHIYVKEGESLARSCVF